VNAYLDHAATTPLRAEARVAWLEASEVVGNASSIHGAGQSARRLLEDARDRLAAALDCQPIEVVFTSGGTESINLALTGLLRARRAATGRNLLVVPEGEHHATLDTVRWLETSGEAEVRWVPIDADARIERNAWHAALADERAAVATLLVTDRYLDGNVQQVKLWIDGKLINERQALRAGIQIPAGRHQVRISTAPAGLAVEGEFVFIGGQRYDMQLILQFVPVR